VLELKTNLTFENKNVEFLYLLLPCLNPIQKATPFNPFSAFLMLREQVTTQVIRL